MFSLFKLNHPLRFWIAVRVAYNRTPQKFWCLPMFSTLSGWPIWCRILPSTSPRSNRICCVAQPPKKGTNFAFVFFRPLSSVLPSFYLFIYFYLLRLCCTQVRSRSIITGSLHPKSCPWLRVFRDYHPAALVAFSASCLAFFAASYWSSLGFSLSSDDERQEGEEKEKYMV